MKYIPYDKTIDDIVSFFRMIENKLSSIFIN